MVTNAKGGAGGAGTPRRTPRARKAPARGVKAAARGQTPPPAAGGNK